MRRLRFSTLTAITAALFLGTGISAHDGEHEGGEVMVISSVVPGSAADKAGLVAGDRIVTWDGQQITTQRELSAFLDAFQPGDEIALTLSREDQTLELPLTFGSRADGGVSIGVSLGVATQSAPDGSGEGFSPEECLEWIDEMYRMASMAQTFGLDLTTEIAEIRSCTDRNTHQMSLPIPQTWCDNVFKIHCSGLDFLAEIADAQVARCEASLSASLGVDISRNQTWNVCGAQKVFDRYSMRGKASDDADCRQILIDECGAEIDG